MTEIADGWPFLVARARRRGYGTVLAPDFLAELGEQDLLADHAGGGLRPGDVRRLELPHRDLGPMTLWFTVEPVTSAIVGQHDPERNGRPRDEHGRPLEVIYGIVVRGVADGEVGAPALQTARERAIATFRRLLDGEDRFTLECSRPFPLPGVSVVPSRAHAEAPPELPPARHRRRPPRPKRRSRARAGLLAVAVALASVWLLWPADPRARIVDLGAAPEVSCSATETVRLHAIVAVREGDGDKPTRVDYRWLREKDQIGSGSVRVVPGRRVSVGLETPRPAIGEKGVRYAFVLVRPEGAEQSFTYEPRCRPTSAH